MDNTKKITAKNMDEKEYFFGHKACAGCGGSIAVRLALKVFGERTFAALPAGCMSAVGFIYPQMAFLNNAIISTFPGTGSILAGMRAGLNAIGEKDVQVVGFAGDGGTADIGIQALSGAIDRNDDIVYICYDNEAYMNTGIQKSGLTPFGARTTTTPAGKNIPGSITSKKNMFEIAAAHDIPYAATASIGYPQDYINKLTKARDTTGPSYIHVYASCPTGWGSSPETSVSIAKDAVDCGLWYLAEYEDGEFTINKKPETFTPVENYLKQQARFRHLTDDLIQKIIENRDLQWKRMLKRWN